MTATFGELGEAANVAKKLNRVRDGIPGNKQSASELRAKLANEIADAYIYLDLMAQSQGIDLSTAVVQTFNAKSLEIGYPDVLVACPLCGDLGYTENGVGEERTCGCQRRP
jgi:hypothetical protein